MRSRREGRNQIASGLQPHTVCEPTRFARRYCSHDRLRICSSRFSRVRSDANSRRGSNVTKRHSLEAMVSRIIPAGADGHGALEAGCARYIESALGDAYQSQRKTYSTGLAALNSRAVGSGGQSFAALSAIEQDRILSDFEHNTKVGDYGDSAAFFELVRRHTLEGMFGDPSYGGNANFAGWDLIGYPGPRMFASPEMQSLDAKIPRSRKSAKELVHGSR